GSRLQRRRENRSGRDGNSLDPAEQLRQCGSDLYGYQRNAHDADGQCDRDVGLIRLLEYSITGIFEQRHGIQGQAQPDIRARHENDGVTATTSTRFERLFSPIWTAPANSDYITIDMDVAYNLEDESLYNLYAYDGVCLRVTDQTGGSFLLRSVLAEAFAKDFM